MPRNSSSDHHLRDRVSFDVSLRFEIFFALGLIADRNARIHGDWKRKTLEALPGQFHQELSAIGSTPILWATFPDVLETEPLDLGFHGIVRSIERLPIRDFQRRLLLGLVHYDHVADALLEHRRTTAACLAQIPKVKQEWLAFIGLYPYDPNRAEARVIESLLQDPAAFRTKTLVALQLFWDTSFKNIWQDLLPQLQRSAEEKERAFHTCTFTEFARQAVLRVEVDEKRRVLTAVRGGFKLDIGQIDTCHFLPSAFNDRRYWTSFDVPGGKTVVYFPYFDPALALDPRSWLGLASARRPGSPREPELDPALIFRALGDSTRYAIVSLLAQEPRSSIELAKTLSLSKPAISHHIAKLREAGLLQEQPAAGTIQLSLKREVLENLSAIVIDRLFDSEQPVELKTTRSRA